MATFHRAKRYRPDEAAKRFTPPRAHFTSNHAPATASIHHNRATRPWSWKNLPVIKKIFPNYGKFVTGGLPKNVTMDHTSHYNTSSPESIPRPSFPTRAVFASKSWGYTQPFHCACLGWCRTRLRRFMNSASKSSTMEFLHPNFPV